MKRWSHRWSVVVVLVIVALVLGACALGGPSGPQIKVENAWARPSRVGMGNMGGGEMGQGNMGGMTTSAVFMTIINEGKEPDRLVGVKSDAAENVEIHQSIMEGDVMRMQPVEGGIEIPAKGQVELKPGGYHIMLINLKRELKPGDRITVVLEFEKSGQKTLQVEVKEM